MDVAHSEYILLSVNWAVLTRDARYGWCGNTSDHCGNGCISGCTPSSPPANSGNVPRSDGRCGKDFGGVTCDPNGPFGGCCSQYGYVYSLAEGRLDLLRTVGAISHRVMLTSRSIDFVARLQGIV